MKPCFAKNVFLLWVMAMASFPLACGDGCSEEQTRALLEIRNSTNGHAFAGWDKKDCCEAERIKCYSLNWGVKEIYLGEASSTTTWYPNVTLFTLFDELEVLSLGNMQIGGKLQRSIPSEVGELSQIRSLKLSNNLLTCLIPNSFQNLKNVESLDLSHNNLRWRIPYELVELTFLSTFSVAYNNLLGRVSIERQFSTFETQCYDGNPDLCGVPLPRNCSTRNQLELEHEDEKRKTRIIDNPLFFYAFVALSYAFRFWVFFGILIINKNWRQRYFRAVDRYIESYFQILSKYW